MALGISGEQGPAGAASQSKGARDALAAGPGRSVDRGPTMDSRARNPRYSQRPIATGPMSLHNMAALANLAAPGGSLRAALGIGPQYEGVTPRSGTGYDYDSPNRLGQGQFNGNPMAMSGLHRLLLARMMSQPRPAVAAPVAPANPFSLALQTLLQAMGRSPLRM